MYVRTAAADIWRRLLEQQQQQLGLAPLQLHARRHAGQRNARCTRIRCLRCCMLAPLLLSTPTAFKSDIYTKLMDCDYRPLPSYPVLCTSFFHLSHAPGSLFHLSPSSAPSIYPPIHHTHIHTRTRAHAHTRTNVHGNKLWQTRLRKDQRHMLRQEHILRFPTVCLYLSLSSAPERCSSLYFRDKHYCLRTPCVCVDECVCVCVCDADFDGHTTRARDRGAQWPWIPIVEIGGDRAQARRAQSGTCTWRPS